MGSDALSDCFMFNADLDALLVTYPAYGAYSAAAFDGITMRDLSGNSRDATVTTVPGSVSVRTTSGGGASNFVTVLAGGPSSKALWPGRSIPSTFTICSVTRYGYTGSTFRRILTGGTLASSDWFHGHGRGYRGVAKYGVSRSDGSSDPFGFATTMWGPWESKPSWGDWLVMCGTNGKP